MNPLKGTAPIFGATIVLVAVITGELWVAVHSEQRRGHTERRIELSK